MVTCPEARDNHWKRWLIPHKADRVRDYQRKDYGSPWEGLVGYQLVGEVKAHQGEDG